MSRKPMTRAQRGAIVEVLIDHQMAVDERNANRPNKHVLPDLSDIYTGTILRLRTLIRKIDKANEAPATPGPQTQIDECSATIERQAAEIERLHRIVRALTNSADDGQVLVALNAIATGEATGAAVLGLCTRHDGYHGKGSGCDQWHEYPDATSAPPDPVTGEEAAIPMIANARSAGRE